LTRLTRHLRTFLKWPCQAHQCPEFSHPSISLAGHLWTAARFTMSMCGRLSTSVLKLSRTNLTLLSISPYVITMHLAVKRNLARIRSVNSSGQDLSRVITAHQMKSPTSNAPTLTSTGAVFSSRKKANFQVPPSLTSATRPLGRHRSKVAKTPKTSWMLRHKVSMALRHLINGLRIQTK